VQNLHRENEKNYEETEENIIMAFKKLSVMHENMMVSDIKLHGWTQDLEEPIHNFSVRVEFQADVYQFNYGGM
jgi:hypothetical protein